jgi:shikimate dehydrogenase
MSNVKLFGVAGNPILHSKSPLIFNNLFRNNSSVYLRIATDTPEEVIRIFNELGFSGMNVTAPFKTGIIKYLDEIDEISNKVNALNTIVRESNNLKGFNTDVSGVLESFKRNSVQLKDKNVVVLGAGGAGKAASYALVKSSAKVTIVNRTVAKAEKIAKDFDCSFASIDKLEKLLADADILLSALSLDVDLIESDWLKKSHVIFDANYKNSKLIAKAKKKGCKTINGEEWLVNQAIPAFKYFTGKEADISLLNNAIDLSKDIYENRTSRISLIGFMGMGKSAIGQKLANILGWGYINIDSLIEEKAGKTISEIFDNEGEPAFRKIESATLNKVINKTNVVISCGGGIILDKNNRNLLKNNSIVIWLYSPLKTITDRINTDTRPLLKNGDVLKTAEKLFSNRIRFYAETSDILVANEDKSIDQIAKKIYEEVDKTLRN